MPHGSAGNSLPKGFDPENARWNEPLTSLIVFNLDQHPASRELLRRLIEEQSEEGYDTREIRRMIKEPIQHRAPKKTEFMVKLIAEKGAHLIGALPEQFDGQNIKGLTMALYNALIRQTAFAIDADPLQRKVAALQELFGVQPAHIFEQQNVVGKYFGYRRSTTRGSIIRFSLEIENLGKGIYSFENHFRSNQDDWVVTGTGFFREGNLYLVGNAASKDGEIGRGLRCFAIRPDTGREDFMSGLVLTTEASKRPVAARILLIPVECHSNAERPDSILDLQQILLDGRAKNYWITDDVNIDQLDSLIDIADLEKPSTLITKGIRNGTVSTVRFDGCEGLSDGSAVADEAALLDLLIQSGGNPTILYLRAIKGAEDRLKQGRS